MYQDKARAHGMLSKGGDKQKHLHLMTIIRQNKVLNSTQGKESGEEGN